MKETLNWKKLIKVPKKLFSGLLAASMAFTCVVDQNFTTVHAAKKDPIREEKRNPEINPEFTIQHYLVKCKIKCANYCSEKVTISCSG